MIETDLLLEAKSMLRLGSVKVQLKKYEGVYHYTNRDPFMEIIGIHLNSACQTGDTTKIAILELEKLQGLALCDRCLLLPISLIDTITDPDQAYLIESYILLKTTFQYSSHLELKNSTKEYANLYLAYFKYVESINEILSRTYPNIIAEQQRVIKDICQDLKERIISFQNKSIESKKFKNHLTSLLPAEHGYYLLNFLGPLMDTNTLVRMTEDHDYNSHIGLVLHYNKELLSKKGFAIVPDSYYELIKEDVQADDLIEISEILPFEHAVALTKIYTEDSTVTLQELASNISSLI